MEESIDKPTILIIEDERDLQAMYSERFTMAGINVLQAFDGIEAMKVFREHPEIKVIVVDIMLPKQSGYEVIKEIRAMALDRDIPIVVSSALNGEEEKREGMEAGATAYISKGETPLPQVVEMVKQYLD